MSKPDTSGIDQMALRPLIDKVKKRIKNDPTIKEMLDKYDVDSEEIDLVPMCFAHIDVSARTDHGIIYFNIKLVEDGNFDDDDHYLVHELTHYFQQTTGNKATQGANEGDYLENEDEIEGFQNQTKYLSETRGEKDAEEYVDQVLDHHEVSDEEEREDKKEELLSEAQLENRNLIALRMASIKSFVYDLIKYAGLNEFLSSLGISEDIIAFLDTLPNDQKQFYVATLRQNPNITLEELQQYVAIPQKIDPYTDDEKSIVSNLNQNLAEWYLIQFRKNRNNQNYNWLSDNIDYVNNWYNQKNPDLPNHTLDDVQFEVELMKSAQPNTQLDSYLSRVNEPLRSYLYTIIPQLTPQDFATNPRQLEQIQREGKEYIDHLMRTSIDSVSDYFKHNNIKLRNFGLNKENFKQLLDNVEHWHRMQCSNYPSNDYDPLNPDLVVYGPKDNGYFIVELVSENDLMVEGKKLKHCVGSYVNAVESGNSRIFSLRDSGNEPHVTIETNPGASIVRQVYAFNNTKPNEEEQRIIDDWLSIFKQDINIDKLTEEDKFDLARNPDTSAETLDKLSNDKDVDVRRYVARNPNTPAEILDKLSNDENEYVRTYVASNHNTPAETLDKLSNDENEYVRRFVALNPNTSAETLDKLSNDENASVRKFIAENPNTPAEILDKLSNDKDADVRRYVAQNTNTPAEILDKLSNNENKYVREHVARNTNTSVEILDKLSNDENKYVREHVARNPNIPVETLDKLSNDENASVRIGVARNPNTPAEILDKLSNDENEYVREHVARNPNIPVETLDKLSNDENKYVRRYVAQNTNTPAEILDKLSNDKDADVRRYVARNPNTTVETLDKLRRKTTSALDQLKNDNA